jgi:hypothetical protein
MHFDKNELPEPLVEIDAQMLRSGDVIIDEHGTPWIIRASAELLAVLDTKRTIKAFRHRACQLIWKNEKLKRHTDVRLIDLPAGKVKTYHPDDIVKAVKTSIAEFDAKLAAL